MHAVRTHTHYCEIFLNIFFSYLRLDLPSVLFPPRFPSKACAIHILVVFAELFSSILSGVLRLSSKFL